MLLRFLFDDGTVMASYDHDPPTSAQEWQPETPVTYTRRIFAARDPYFRGDVRSSSPLSSSGKRLRLFGKESATACTRSPDSSCTPADPRRPSNGWHRHEGDGEGGYRWTQSRATLTFRNPRQDSVLHLRLSAQPDVFPAPQQAASTSGAVRCTLFRSRRTRPITRCPLTAANFGADDEVLVTIAVDRTFVPAEVQKGGDHRELGVRVHNMFLETLVRK